MLNWWGAGAVGTSCRARRGGPGHLLGDARRRAVAPPLPGTARPGSPSYTGPDRAGPWPAGPAVHDHCPGRQRLPGGGAVPDLVRCWPLKGERLAAAPELVTGRLAVITPQDPGHPALHVRYYWQPQGSSAHAPLHPVRGGRGPSGRHGQAADALGLWPVPGAHRRADVQHLDLPLSMAGHVNFCPDVQQLVKTVGEVRPTAFFGVPRVWEKIRAGIQALLAAEPDPDLGPRWNRPWTSAAGTWKAP